MPELNNFETMYYYTYKTFLTGIILVGAISTIIYLMTQNLMATGISFGLMSFFYFAYLHFKKNNGKW